MVKHIQTIRRLLPTNFFSVFDHFVGLLLKGLKMKKAFDNALGSLLVIQNVLIRTFSTLTHIVNGPFFAPLMLSGRE